MNVRAKGASVLEVVVGFSVVSLISLSGKRPVEPTYVPTVGCSNLTCAVDRIPKEMFDAVDGPMRLLEVLKGLHFYYRKQLTRKFILPGVLPVS